MRLSAVPGGSRMGVCAVFSLVLAVVTILPGIAWGEAPPVGVNAGAPIWGGSILFSDALAADIAGSGCRFVRVNFRIDGHETWTPEHLAKYDEIIQTARDHDLQVLGLICYEAVYGSQAEWNENWDTTGMNPYIAEFAANAYLLIDRYKDDVKLFELWNEPSCWSVPPTSNPLEPGCFYIWPKNYSNLLAETYKACIAQGGANFFTTHGISLVTGGLFAHDIGGSFTTARDYMTSVYTQTAIWNAFEADPLNPSGRRYPWDYFGYHFYLNQGSAVSTTELTAYFNDIRSMKGIYNDDTDFLLTEFGWNTQGVSLQLQAENLRDTYNWLRAQPDVAGSMWYQWNDGDGGWGLVYSIGNPKPSYFELAAQCGTQPVSAGFLAQPVFGSAPLAVQFTSTSLGTIDTYAWSFGDGGSSAATNPVHIYEDADTYTVAVTVSGPGGTDTETKTGYITVIPPTVLGDLDGDGDVDLADYALLARCHAGAGVTLPPEGCEGGAELVSATTQWELAASLGDLSASLSADDLIHGMLGSKEAGGFYANVPGGETGGLLDLTDGVPGTTLEAVLADYSRPSLQVRYDFASPLDIGRINVFAANNDGRVFQNYDVAYSVAGDPSFQTLVENVTSGPFGQVNNGDFGATRTSVVGQVPGAIALDVDGLRFTLYDVSTVSPANVFWDERDAGEPGDTDGNPQAYVSSIIKEIDVFAAEPGNIADLDGDGDADVDDLALFAGAMVGPQ